MTLTGKSYPVAIACGVEGTPFWRGIIQKALADRLAAVETQKYLAASIDFPASA